MKIVTWNVNSIKVRLEHVIQFLEYQRPDALMIQEIKGMDFPHETFQALGYHSESVTQKAYNGVAILSVKPIKTVHRALPGYEDDEQARYLEIDIDGLRLINIYLPNGNPAPSEKYDYKLEWMDHLYHRLKDLRECNTPFLIGGDFNVIPEDKDCYDPTAWKDDALFLLKTRKMFRCYLNLGLTDAFRIHEDTENHYSFWDYQRGAWQRDHGIRIDHFLLSPSITDIMQSCTIDRTPRGWDKPSDHTPVIIEINR